MQSRSSSVALICMVAEHCFRYMWRCSSISRTYYTRLIETHSQTRYIGQSEFQCNAGLKRVVAILVPCLVTQLVLVRVQHICLCVFNTLCFIETHSLTRYIDKTACRETQVRDGWSRCCDFGRLFSRACFIPLVSPTVMHIGMHMCLFFMETHSLTRYTGQKNNRRTTQVRNGWSRCWCLVAELISARQRRASPRREAPIVSKEA